MNERRVIGKVYAVCAKSIAGWQAIAFVTEDFELACRFANEHNRPDCINIYWVETCDLVESYEIEAVAA